MEGYVINKRIHIDCWKLSKSKQACYFLSQLLPDINPAINNNWPYPIYSSEPNLRALACFTNVRKDLLRPLTFRKKTLIKAEGFTFVVTAIDTYSLTGSVIYHFSCKGKDYLYIGKLNITSSILSNAYIRDLSENESIDTLICSTDIIDLPIEFSVETAADQIECIFRSNPDKRLVISVNTFGMEDLLQLMIMRFYSVYAGCKRYTYLKFQEQESPFSTNKYAALRAVNKCFCRNVHDCYRRYVQKNVITIIPSLHYSLQDIYKLKKVGVYIIPFDDNITARALYHLITTIKPVHLRSCTKRTDFYKFKPYFKYCRIIQQDSIIREHKSKDVQDFVIDFKDDVEQTVKPEPIVKSVDINIKTKAYCNAEGVVLLKRLSDDEVLTERQKVLKKNNDIASAKIAELSVPELEPFQQMHLFTKHKLQFMEDNFIDKEEMSKNLYRFHIQHHLACIERLKKCLKDMEDT